MTLILTDGHRWTHLGHTLVPGNPQTLNLYAYGNDNPVNNVDSQGTNAWNMAFDIANLAITILFPEARFLDIAGILATELSYDVVEYAMGWDGRRGSRQAVLVLSWDVASTLVSLAPKWFPGRWQIANTLANFVVDEVQNIFSPSPTWARY